MFSAKFNFIKTTVSSTLPLSSGLNIYLTMDYAYQAQPFVNIIPNANAIPTSSGIGSLDYVYMGEPFNGNNTILLNS